MATNVAPDPGLGSAGARSVAPPASGGGSWRPLSDERKEVIQRATAPATDSSWRGTTARDQARKEAGLTTATNRDNPGERVKSTQVLAQERGGVIAAAVLGGMGVIGTAVAIARGGGWWVSLVFFPAAGAAYYFTRFKSPPAGSS